MTKKEAQEYIDNYISHIISMVEYGNWFYSEISILVEDCKKDLNKILSAYEIAKTKNICREIENEITTRLEELAADITEFILKQIDDTVNLETDWLNENVAKPLGIDFKYSDKFAKMLTLIPIATAGVVGEFGKTIASRLKDLYHQQIMQSYVMSTKFEENQELFTSRMNTFDRGLKVDSETLGSSLSGQYDRIVFTKNDEQIQEYMWLALLDSHTCICCGEMDHKIFKKTEDIPVFPYHANCRCRCILITDEIKENIPQSYEEWFESRSKSEKYKILGRERFKLYENGMKIKNFVNNGKKTPLKDL